MYLLDAFSLALSHSPPGKSGILGCGWPLATPIQGSSTVVSHLFQLFMYVLGGKGQYAPFLPLCSAYLVFLRYFYSHSFPSHPSSCLRTINPWRQKMYSSWLLVLYLWTRQILCGVFNVNEINTVLETERI